jgi:hypothetical protein
MDIMNIMNIIDITIIKLPMGITDIQVITAVIDDKDNIIKPWN